MNREQRKNHSKPIMRVMNGNMQLDKVTLKRLFLKHLDNVYCVKKHLVKILPSIAEKASFDDLRSAIITSIDLIKMQILRMDVIYKIMKGKYNEANCTAIKDFSIEAATKMPLDSKISLENDLTLLIHLQIIESHEIAYFDVLKSLTPTLHDMEIETLLEQNFDTSISSKNLYELIAKEYLGI